MTWENCSSVCGHGPSCLMLDRKFVVIKRCGPESESAAGSETWLVYKGRFTDCILVGSCCYMTQSHSKIPLNIILMDTIESLISFLHYHPHCYC